MKNTNAHISIKSVIVQNGEAGEIEVVTEGSYIFKNGKYYIIYKESANAETEETTTTVKTDGKCLWVKRSGGVESSMQYCVGETHTSIYRFNFGAITMETTTHSLDIRLNETGGTIEVAYLLDMGGNKSENNLNIRIKENANI